MTETVSLPVHKLVIGNDYWIDRADIDLLQSNAFYFEVVEYDDPYLKVVITGHADGDRDD